MARRISWTNNSSGHSGTYVYRAATLDPQNLPAPVATVDPVAQGETAEWMDSEELADGDYCYAVKDFDSGGESQLSDNFCITIGDDFSTAQIGDYIGGGVYAGTITYDDAREFHIIFAEQSGEADPALVDTRWQTDETSIAGSNSTDDGWQNTQDILASGKSHPAANHCDFYSADGKTDWYLPAPNEIALESNLRDHPELSTETSNDRWTSRETNSSSAATRSFTGSSLTRTKTITSRRVRPIRRVLV